MKDYRLPIINCVNPQPTTHNPQLNKGFTLIELLIVIGLLGVLAIGLVATIDPFEQLKKGTDTSRENITTSVYESAIRYYSSKSIFPWDTDLTGMPLSDASMTSGATSYLQLIVTAGELKPEFIQLNGSANLSKIFITSTADPVSGARQNITVCYMPESKSFQSKGNTKYMIDGQSQTNCISGGGTGSCYWCVK